MDRSAYVLGAQPFHLATGKALLDMTHEMQARIREVNFPFFVVHGTGMLVDNSSLFLAHARRCCPAS